MRSTSAAISYNSSSESVSESSDESYASTSVRVDGIESESEYSPL